MSSLRKLESARRNGALSNGPKTPEGKAISSLNALRHGLAAQTLVLCNESHDRFDMLREAYVDEFQPETPSEQDAVEEMIAAKWRQRRIWGVETATFDLAMDKNAADFEKQFAKSDEMTRLAVAFQSLADNSAALRMLRHYSVDARREYDRAFQRLLDLRILNRNEEQDNDAQDKERQNMEEQNIA